MNARTWFVHILLVAVVFGSCGNSPLRLTKLPTSYQDVKLPDFVDDPAPQTNMDLATPRQQLVFYRNYASIEEILKRDSTLVVEEMARRLSGNQPMSLKLLAAAVLVFKNADKGNQFFQSQVRVIDNHLDDVYVTLSQIDISGQYLNGTDANMVWAEDLMVEALQNRTQLDRREALRIPENVSFSDNTIEVRELAVNHGRFPEILGKMRSEKALPVIISMIRENRPFYSLDLRGAIASLGKYKDKRVGVEPLVLEILKRHEDSNHWDTYPSAVSAAVQLELKSAVPILLRHLDDNDSYGGLKALADASAIPIIKRALPRLKSYARAEAELTLIHLQGGDVLPSLLQLLSRRNFLRRDDVIMWIERLKDARSVAAMTEALCHDPDWFVRSWAIRVLAVVRTREAITSLINGLGCDYSRLKEMKMNADHDYNREYRDKILKALIEITGKDLGTDNKKWLSWLNQQRTF
ncbi:MAG TPA: HEAT repeat domain-containing protein [Pyrinomonadaceae bacterium]|nr:HEAT repeat domain-containing protein [Pyrinomonadaceae bacterium]